MPEVGLRVADHRGRVLHVAASTKLTTADEGAQLGEARREGRRQQRISELAGDEAPRCERAAAGELPSAKSWSSGGSQ